MFHKIKLICQELITKQNQNIRQKSVDVRTNMYYFLFYSDGNQNGEENVQRELNP